MKKLATLLIAAGLAFSMAPSANAIDFKAHGQWLMSFEYGMNGGFTRQTGYNGSTDRFDAKQRLRLWVDAVASENLSGQVYFELGNQNWGGASTGGALGADGIVVEVRDAFIDWMIPDTNVKVRMGLQGMSLPSFVSDSNIFQDDVAGITVSARFNDNAGLTLFWARPYNDNFGGDGVHSNASYMDNVDLFGLTIPLNFDGIKITPYGMVAAIGPNAFSKDGNGNISNTDLGTCKTQMKQGLFPAWGVISSAGSVIGSDDYTLDNYGVAWWAGITGDLNFDPIRVAFDVMGGSVQWDEERMNRAGWLALLLVEYKMDFGIPGILGWYASGDDDDLGNGSERLPYVSVSNGDSGISSFAWDGNPYIGREGVIGGNMAGTWGVGVRLKDFSFIENLKHTFRATLIGGTNDAGVLKQLYRMGMTKAVNSTTTGVGSLYMTEGDSALEIGLCTNYKMYDNFTVALDANYIAMFMTDDEYGGIKKQLSGASTGHDVRDAWNINLSFSYDF